MRKLLIGIGSLCIVLAIVFQLRMDAGTQNGSAAPNVVKAENAKQEALAGIEKNIEKVSMSPFPNTLLLVRPEGAVGSAIAFDKATRQPRFMLTPGLLTGDGKHYYSAYARLGKTAFYEFDLGTGLILKSYAMDGEWALSKSSLTGHWLAFVKIPPKADEKQVAANAWQEEAPLKWGISGAANPNKESDTELQIYDTAAGRVARNIVLAGDYEVDTVSDDGKTLYLIHHFPDHYVVETFDIMTGTLEGEVNRKGEDEVMAGYAQGAVMTPDGKWLLTLYVSTARDEAFIHALDVAEKFAVCIDLPSENGSVDSLRQYALSISPDGRKMFATNAALGIVAEIVPEELQVTRQVHFTPSSRGAVAYDESSSQSVVADDGSTVFFTNGWEVWAYETGIGNVRSLGNIGTPIVGLGVGEDGKRLYVANASQQLDTFDLTGEMGWESASAENGLNTGWGAK